MILAIIRIYTKIWLYTLILVRSIAYATLLCGDYQKNPAHPNRTKFESLISWMDESEYI